MEPVRFLLGSDPELFLQDVATEKFRSAIPVIAEGKGAGRPLDSTGQNSVLHDNVLIEFNTKPAESCPEFVQTVGSVLRSIEAIVAERGLRLHLQASTSFPEEELDCEEARVFGCDPDYDAYELEINIVPEEAAASPFRSAGGHLHIGKHAEDGKLGQLLEDPYGKVRVVKALDLFVGLIGVFLDKDPTAAARRGLYGKAGAHRPKDYGVEYRACSPWWLETPRHTELVYRLSEAALSAALDERRFDKLIDIVGGERRLQKTINKSQVKRARNCYDRHLRKLLSPEVQWLVSEVDGADANFRTAWFG